MSIRCAIVDDEPIAAKGIAGYANKIGFLEVKEVFHSAIELNDYLQENSLDLVFLDIEMPYLTGISWLKSMKNPPKVIFTTAYDQYALEGFELDVIDYLLKPVSFERFVKAANKARDLIGEKNDHIFIRCDGRLEKLGYADIVFVEALQNYVTFHTTDQKFITHLTLKSVEEQLPAELFIKTHKSYIVNKEAVRSIDGLRIILSNHATVPIGKTLKESVLEKITGQKIIRK